MASDAKKESKASASVASPQPIETVNPDELPAELAGWERYRQEGFKEKFMRKFKENPFVPVGMITTAVVLSMGLAQFRRGDRRKSQTMMRMRIGAQGFTVMALIMGIVVTATKGSSKK
ncbi:HIG1 domain family member 2A, mitochondrial-like [Ptychodera flava]|uniref:HIG1 domain family member 2A, mitochondrial-like n=1 Tax=Ptychodera flava TaxID=63121 RepID=UPI00396A9F10